MTMCETAECNDTAVARVFWPGAEPLAMCQPCTNRAERVAATVGVHIPTEALEGFHKITIVEPAGPARLELVEGDDG